jgi:hypothetical protein
MTNEQIGTLLAAIAGYVLGKGVARAQSVNETKTSEASSENRSADRAHERVDRKNTEEKTEDRVKR